MAPAEAPRPNITTRPSRPKPRGRKALGGNWPWSISFQANQAPKTKTSQAMPTRAPPPPASRLNRRGDQPCSSPTSRRRVTARVMTEGTRMRSRKLTLSDIRASCSVETLSLSRSGGRFTSPAPSVSAYGIPDRERDPRRAGRRPVRDDGNQHEQRLDAGRHDHLLGKRRGPVGAPVDREPDLAVRDDVLALLVTEGESHPSVVR